MTGSAARTGMDESAARSSTGRALGRRTKQAERQQRITDAVMAEGTVRIEDLAERFDISVMTVHRDLDELESRGLLHKSRGAATALPSVLVESSDVFRAGRQLAEKDAIAHAALDFIEPGQAIFLDDSTTTLHLTPLLEAKSPLTVITNTTTVIEALRDVRGIRILGLGGQYYNWCSAFMGPTTTAEIRAMRADLSIMSTSAITDGLVFHQTLETVDVKRAMFESSSRRVLLVDHTKFEHRAMHALLPLHHWDAVIVDSGTPRARVDEMRAAGVDVIVAKRQGK